MSGTLVPICGPEICNDFIFSTLAAPELPVILVSGVHLSLPVSRKNKIHEAACMALETGRGR
jgi:hypothetical protein